LRLTPCQIIQYRLCFAGFIYMYTNSYHDNKPGSWKGGKSFGGGGRGFGGGGFNKRGPSDRGGFKTMHPATCEKCNSRCEVPFKPNGRKPVFCSDCFVKDGDSGPSRFASRDNRSERPSYRPDSGVSDQLKMINSKLDAIIQALED